MAYIKCPVCDQPNPSDADSCSNCGAVLHESIQPGDLPTKKVTSELEPILPQWLQDAREKSRKSTADDFNDRSDEIKGPGATASDLLAGLEAQATEDGEEIPDWLASITGVKGTKKESPTISGAHRVELEGFDEFAADDELRGMDQGAEQADWMREGKDPVLDNQKNQDLQDWFRQATATGQAGQPISAEDASSKGEFEDSGEEAAAPAQPDQDLFGGLAPEQPEAAIPAEDSAVPDWLKNLENEPVAQENPTGLSSIDEAALKEDWISQLKTETSASDSDESLPTMGETEIPEWLKDLASEPSAQEQAEIPEWMVSRDETFEAASESQPQTSDKSFSLDWLDDLRSVENTSLPGTQSQSDELTSTGSEIAETTGQAGENGELQEADLPDWLVPPASETPSKSLDEDLVSADWLAQGETAPTIPNEMGTIEPVPAFDAELPDWLQNANSESPINLDEESDLPVWLKKEEIVEEKGAVTEPEELASEFAEETPAISDLPGASRGADVPELEQQSEKAASIPPFTTPEPLTLGSLDPLFTDVPEWLLEASDSAATEEAELPPAAEEGQTISPGNLPSWVQAMRPVEATEPSRISSGEEVLETKGALAGLRGVLPLSTSYPGPSSKPKAQSAKMHASEEQQSHADLLEQIVLAETQPQPMTVIPRVPAQRGWRLTIGTLLFVVLLGVIFTGTQIFPLPVGWPVETMSALTAVESVPPGSPVLIVFDYEPSLAGEMEAAAAPLLDHLIIRNHPRITIISTSPTGSSLAERLFNGPLRDLQYRDLTNLGYLPGGLGGIRSFAQDPLAAMPLAADASAAWETPSTAGIQKLADYSAIIVIVDKSDAGRIWIEQTKGLYTNAAFIVVSSAQAGPMLQPYYESGQISGLVTGLFDSAVLEQNNAGRPGLARTYWDAYNLALILSIILIVSGGTWNLITGMQERRSMEAG